MRACIRITLAGNVWFYYFELGYFKQHCLWPVHNRYPEQRTSDELAVALITELESSMSHFDKCAQC